MASAFHLWVRWWTACPHPTTISLTVHCPPLPGAYDFERDYPQALLHSTHPTMTTQMAASPYHQFLHPLKDLPLSAGPQHYTSVSTSDSHHPVGASGTENDGVFANVMAAAVAAHSNSKER